jgi:hypothetical protein
MDATSFTKLFECLKEAEVVAHIKHLKTDSYAEHMAIGGYYDALNGLTDRLCEAYLHNGNELILPSLLKFEIPGDFRSYLEEKLNEVRTAAIRETELDIQNILAEISELHKKTRYLLSLS